MNIKVYSKFTEIDKEDNEISCYLCETTLREYVENIPNDFESYGIQREIISNIYLDKLVDTVINKRYIPNISLITDEGFYIRNNTTKLRNFRILDGLQRTYRLKLIYETYKLLLNKIKSGENYKDCNKRMLSKEIGDELVNIDSSIQLFFEIKENFYNEYDGDITEFEENFMVQKQWIEVWTNLTLDDEVEKMLLLNAGQRSVSNKHQIELLFIRVLPKIEEVNSNYKIYREKQISSVKFSKIREKGQYHFTNIIASLIAFSYGKPITINKQLILDIKDDRNQNISLRFINLEFIHKMLDFLYKLDEVVENDYGKKGIQWISRETVLVSIFGALGVYKNQLDFNQIFDKFIDLIGEEKVLDLDKFEAERRSLDLSKVNIGSATKNSIYNSILEILTEKWGTSNMFFYK